MYLLLDENNVVRCMASEECNLHKDKIAAGMKQVQCANSKGIVGDKYFYGEDKWEAHPENYPQPTEEEVQEQRIQAEMTRLVRKQAIQNLLNRNEL